MKSVEYHSLLAKRSQLHTHNYMSDVGGFATQTQIALPHNEANSNMHTGRMRKLRTLLPVLRPVSR